MHTYMNALYTSTYTHTHIPVHTYITGHKSTYIYIYISFFFFVVLRPNAGHGLLILEVSRSHTTTHHSRYDSSGRVISSTQSPVPDKTQHSQQRDIHAPGEIRTNDLSKRVAADLHIRPRGYWYQHIHIYITYEYTHTYKNYIEYIHTYTHIRTYLHT